MNSILSKRGLAIATAGCAIVSVGTVQASGFRLPEISIAGLGLANALVANPEEPGAIAYNPAAMAFQDGHTLAAGAVLIDFKLSAKPVTHGPPDFSPPGLSWPVTGMGPKVDSDIDSPAVTGNLSWAYNDGSDWSWGININTPFGLETHWPDHTFDTFDIAGQTGVPGFALAPALAPTRSLVELGNFNPNVAYRLAPGTSLAVGLDYYYLREVRFDSRGVKMSGDGDGVGWNVALMHVAEPWTFGVSYRSNVTVDIDGTVNANSIGLGRGKASTEIEFPDMFQAGVRYRFNDRFDLEFDFERTGWTSFDELVISHTTGLPINPIVSKNNWDISYAFRLGGTYRLSPKTRLRAGYTFDTTPQDIDYFTARVPDEDRHLFSVGIAHEFEGWTLEAGYMYVRFRDRDYRGLVPFGARGAEANGTTAYDGDYRANAQLLGIGFSTRF